MMRWFGVRAVLPMALAVATAAQQEPPSATWSAPGGAVAFGAPFAVEVRRSWPAGTTAQPFDPALLLPLSVRLRDAVVEPLPDGGCREVRTFEARAYATGDVLVPPFELWLRDGDGQRSVQRFVLPPLRVASRLADPPGDVEWPGDVRDRPTGGPWWLLPGGGLLVVFLGAWLLRPRRAPAVPAAAAPEGPEPALASLHALQLGEDGGADDARRLAYYTELAAIVRDVASRRLHVPALVRTSEELVPQVSVGRDELAQCLAACDLVKFAAARPRAEGHAAARAAALAFVQAVVAAEGGEVA